MQKNHHESWIMLVHAFLSLMSQSSISTCIANQPAQRVHFCRVSIQGNPLGPQAIQSGLQRCLCCQQALVQQPPKREPESNCCWVSTCLKMLRSLPSLMSTGQYTEMVIMALPFKSSICMYLSVLPAVRILQLGLASL